MKRFLFAVFLPCLIIGLIFNFYWTAPVFASIYYVDGASSGGTCSDSINNGTSITTPWCTIGKSSNTAVAGDTVYIRGGTYRETATVANSGTSGNQITFAKYNNESVIINGADSPTSWVSLGNQETGGIFVSGFETGDFSEYTGTTIDGTNSLSVQGSAINHGLYAMKAVYSGVDKNAKVNENITTSSDLYSRIYFKMETGFDLTATGSRFDILYIRHTSTTNLARASIVKTGTNTFEIQGRIEAPTGSSYSASTFYSGSAGEIATGNWYYIELRYKEDASNGGAELWLNGVSKGSVYGLNTSGTNNTPGRVEVGGNSSSSTTPTNGSILYIDDIKIDTNYIGTFVAAGNANIYKNTGITWTTYQVFQDGTRLQKMNSLAEITKAGEWYRDDGTNILYIWTTGSDNPSSHTIDVSRRTMGFDLSNRSYITLDGLNFRYMNSASYGAVELVNSNYVTVKNCNMTDDYGSGIFLHNSSNNTLTANQLVRNLRKFGGGIRFQDGSSNNTISSNTITGIGSSGLSIGVTTGNGMSFCGSDTDGSGSLLCNSTGNNNNTVSSNVISEVWDTCLYSDSNNESNTIEKNICHNVYRQSSSQGGNGFHFALGCSKNIIRNNIIYNTERHGISLRDGNISQGYVPNTSNKIYNNTIYNAGYGSTSYGESGNGINIQGTNPNSDIKNNIVVKAATAALNIDPDSISTIISDYNLFYNTTGSGTSVKYNDNTYTKLSDYITASGLDNHSLSSDPLFADLDNANFKLKYNSSAINSGNSISSILTDYNGTSRPQGNNFDIGAYEFLVPSSATSLTQNSFSGETSLSIGNSINNNSINLKFYINSPNTSDSLTPLIEIQPIGTSFNNSSNYSGTVSSFNSSDILASINISNLSNGSYHWQAAVSNNAGVSNWTSFGSNTEDSADFIINNPISVSTPTNTSIQSSPSCNNQMPPNSPDLFEIRRSGNQANLFFNTAKDPVSYYFIAYGPKNNPEKYSMSFNKSNYHGVLNILIDKLDKKTNYYFKVRAGNGCMPGSWSKTLLTEPNKTAYSSVIKSVFTKTLTKITPKKSAVLSATTSKSIPTLVPIKTPIKNTKSIIKKDNIQKTAPLQKILNFFKRIL